MANWTQDQLEDVACDLCGSRRTSREFQRADGMRVVECAGCGLAFLNPRPKEELLPLFYGNDYFTGKSADSGGGGLRLKSALGVATDEAGPEPRVLRVLSEVFGGLRGRDVLEIGCATGDLLGRIGRAGAKACGIDVSEFAVGIARGRGLAAEAATIEEYAAKHPAGADVVLGLEVIEHVASPSRFLTSVAAAMRPGGLFALSTPNYACAKRFGNDWLGFRTSFEHLYFFSPDSLVRLAAAAGFALRHAETSTLLGGPPPPPGFVARQRKRMQTVRYFVKEAGWLSAAGALIATRYSDHMRPLLGHTLLAVFGKQ
jgi:SAM-dependent methyltransferase